MKRQPILERPDKWVIVKNRITCVWVVFQPLSWLEPVFPRPRFLTWREAWDYTIAKATEAAK